MLLTTWGLVIALSLPLAPTTASAPAPVPTPQFRHYGVNEGLPSSNVYTLVQDRQGFIWAGTRAGLARFDGVSFEVFRHVPGDPSSLPGEDISSVLVDRENRVWVGGEGSGVNLLDPASGRFHHWLHVDGDPTSLAGNDLMALAQAGDGPLWVGLYRAGLDRMTADGKFVHLRHSDSDPSSLASDTVLSLHAEGDGRLWVGTAGGLDLRDADGHFQHIRFEGLSKAPRVWRIDAASDGVRAATSVGLYKIGADRLARRMEPGFLPQHNVLSSVRGDDGSLWVGSNLGLYWVGKHGRHRYFPEQRLLPGGQPGHLVWQILRDHEGGLWLATEDGGIGYLSPDWPDFTRFTHVPDAADSLAAGRTLALLADGRGNLLVGGDGQLDLLDPGTGVVTHLAGKLGLQGLAIRSLARAGTDRWWIGLQGGLALLDGKVLRQVNDPRLSDGARWIATDAAGRVYASPPGAGVVRVDPVSLAVTTMGLAQASEADRETRQLLWHDGSMWRASRDGLSRLTAHDAGFVDVPGVAHGAINAFTLTGGDLWLARPDALEHYRLDGDKAQLLDRVDASRRWPGLVALAITVDQHGRVWIPAEVGLWRYTPADGKFREFSAADGLPSAEFTSASLVRFADGTIYGGTLGGVVGFRPDTQQDHPRPPRLVLTQVSVHRGGKLVPLPHGTAPIDLDWNDRQLRVSVSALSFIDPSRNHYRFRLSGFEPDWVDTGTRGEREFTGLGAGTFRLQVQAAGPGGAWASLPEPLLIHVAAPPWATRWAWMAYTLLVLALGWLGLSAWRRRVDQRHHLQLVEQQRQMAEASSAAKTQFLGTLSHEIRTPMTGVMGMAELLLSTPLTPLQHDYTCAMQRSGSMLLKLLNDALDLTRIEAGRLELEPAPFDPRQLVRDVAQLEQGLAHSKSLRFVLDVADDLPAQLIGDAVRIKQVLLNLANNALKFTEHGSVTLRAQRSASGLLLSVSDTGPGIPEVSQARLFQRFEQEDGPQRRAGSGLGLAICRELVEMMGGSIELESRMGHGSTFRVRLPLPEPAVAMARHEAAGAGKLRLLLVEDDAIVAAVIRGLLEQQHHVVCHVANGLAALAELAHADFDAVLLDLDLPGVDGFQIARLIRQREHAEQHLPIVAVTARSGSDDEAKARAAGMDGFLRKPLSGEDLAHALMQLMAAKRSASEPAAVD